MKIGYIGLGLMGMPCARNLLHAGHELFIWARTPEKVQEVIECGALLCSSPAQVASNVEVLFTNLPNTADVEEVLTGPQGVQSGGKAGLIVADMSTISADAVRRMARELSHRHIELVDAPVSGGTAGAINGTLTFMVGASESAFARIEPVLKCMGSTITRIGPVGSGQVAKCCNQIMLTANIMGIAEAFKFCENMDVDPHKVREALLGGFAASKALELHGQRMLSSDYAPGFKADLHLKDLSMVGDLAMENDIILPVTTIGLDMLSAAVEQGFGKLDSSVIYKIITEM